MNSGQKDEVSKSSTGRFETRDDDQGTEVRYINIILLTH